MRPATIFTAAALLLAPLSAAAQDLAQARSFVLKLYGAYHGDGPDYLGRQAEAVFAPSLLALIRRDRATTPSGDAPTLDGDPICDCQDFHISRVTVDTVAAGPGRAKATARFLTREDHRPCGSTCWPCGAVGASATSTHATCRAWWRS